MQLFNPWANFYIITGSAAAALTGLMFVTVTLAAQQRTLSGREGFSAYSTPTVVHFCAAFLISVVLAAPWRSLFQAALILGLTGAYGVVYLLRKTYRSMGRASGSYTPDIEDRIWYLALPAVAYGALIATAVLLFTRPVDAMFVLAVATTLLIFIGIHNAWDVVTYLALSFGADDAQTTPGNAESSNRGVDS